MFARSAPWLQNGLSPTIPDSHNKAMLTASWLTSSCSWSTLATFPCNIVCCSTYPLYKPAMPSTYSFPNTNSMQNFLICGRQELDLDARSSAFLQGLYFGFLIRWCLVHLSATFSSMQTADQLSWWTPFPGVHSKDIVELCGMQHWSYSLSFYLRPVQLFGIENRVWLMVTSARFQNTLLTTSSFHLWLLLLSLLTEVPTFFGPAVWQCCSTGTKAALGIVTDYIDVFPSCIHHPKTPSHQFVQTKYP